MRQLEIGLDLTSISFKGEHFRMIRLVCFNSGLTVQHPHSCRYFVPFLELLHRSQSSFAMKLSSWPEIRKLVHARYLVADQLPCFERSVPENYSNCDLLHSTVHRQLAMETVHTCVVSLLINDDASQTRCHPPSRTNQNRLRSEQSIYEVKDSFELRSVDHHEDTSSSHNTKEISNILKLFAQIKVLKDFVKESNIFQS